MSDNENKAMGDLRGPVTRHIPEGDDRERLVCTDCGFIHYDNPKIIAGAVCTWEGKFLLCKRAIEPRIGYWTIPAGFMELRESVAEGAAREVVEESGAKVEIENLLGVFEIPRISQVYMVYRARMTSADLDPGPESLSAALFEWDDIPWDELAFPSVKWSLEMFKFGGDGPHFNIHR